MACLQEYEVRAEKQIEHAGSEHDKLHALISSSCFDFCNSLFMGLNKSVVTGLQLVQSAAATLLTGTNRTGVKILVLTSTAFNGQAPEYITVMLTAENYIDCETLSAPVST